MSQQGVLKMVSLHLGIIEKLSLRRQTKLENKKTDLKLGSNYNVNQRLEKLQKDLFNKKFIHL